MYVRACGHRQIQFPAILIAQRILIVRIGRIIHLDPVADLRSQFDILQVSPLPVRMRLDQYRICRGMYTLIHLFACHGHNVFVFQQPLLIDPVDQILIALKIEFHTEEHIKILTLCCRKRFFVSAHIPCHTFVPRQAPVDRTVSVKKMIRYDHPLKATLLHKIRIICAGNLSACTGLGGVGMCFV